MYRRKQYEREVKKNYRIDLFYLSCILIPPIVWLLPYTSYREHYLFLLLFIGFMFLFLYMYLFFQTLEDVYILS
jgi:hypothetical protein